MWIWETNGATTAFWVWKGETLAEGQLRTTQEDIAEFFQALNAARVVFEVGTHSPWVQGVIRGCGHEVLVANPRLMDGSKRRKRKNDRIDANKLARLGRVDPESLYPIQHRSREVRQDLVILRARDALVAARTEIINTTRGLVKSMGTRLPKCSSRSFAQKGEEAVAVEMREALLPLVRLAATLSADIKEYDKKIEELGREKYGHTALLRQVKGVGPITERLRLHRCRLDLSHLWPTGSSLGLPSITARYFSSSPSDSIL